MSINKEAMLAVADVIEYADRLATDTYAADKKTTRKLRRAERKANATGDWTDYFEVSAGIKPQHEIVPTIWDNCETTGCIAGWVLALAVVGAADFTTLAGKELGLTKGQGFNLFVSSEWWRQQGFPGAR